MQSADAVIVFAAYTAAVIHNAFQCAVRLRSWPFLWASGLPYNTVFCITVKLYPYTHCKRPYGPCVATK